jgi:predicted MFS family arabinose efflux permease
MNNNSTPLPSNFWRLAAANLAAQSAEQISLAAVPMIAVLSLGAGAGQIGLLAAAQTLPFFLLAIPLGLLADRLPRPMIMRVAEIVRTVALLGLLLCAATGIGSLPLLAILGFLGATGTVAFSVAAPAYVPSLVAREQLPRANAKLELARSAAFAAGPALSGALVAWTGASAAFVVASILSASAVAMLWQLSEQRPAVSSSAKRQPLKELQDGWQAVWHQEWLRAILLTSVAWNISWFVLHAAFVPYAMRALGMSADRVGLSLAAYGAGMVVGALIATRVMRRITLGKAILLGPACSVMAIFGLVSTQWLAGSANAHVLTGASFFFFGVGPIIWTISTTTLRQSITPAAMLGRVTAIFLTVNMGARPVGALLGAAVGWVFTANTQTTQAHLAEIICLWLSAAGFVIQLLIIASSSVRQLQALPKAA